jgi:hypothetical protein
MRTGSLVLAALLPAAVLADREIYIPTGSKVPFRTVRFEYMLLNTHQPSYDALLAIGVTKEVEAEFWLDRIAPRSALGTFNVAYNFFSPIADTLPGISVGMQDVMNRTDLGRRLYLAGTYRIGTGGEMGADFLDINLGIAHGRRTEPFIGVLIPLSAQVRLLAEHDGEQPTAGVELRPSESLAFRWMARQHQTFYSLRWTTRF